MGFMNARMNDKGGEQMDEHAEATGIKLKVMTNF